jgi:putative heme-binding domain-containing protein
MEVFWKKNSSVDAVVETLWSLGSVPIEDIELDLTKKLTGSRERNHDIKIWETMHRLVGTPQVPVRLSLTRFSGIGLADLRGERLPAYQRIGIRKLSHKIIDWNSFKESQLLGQGFLIKDPFIFATLIMCVDRNLAGHPTIGGKGPQLVASGRARLGMLLAVRRHDPRQSDYAEFGLRDTSPAVRRAAVQWVAEENLKELRPQVEAILDSKSMTTDLFLATLAALEMLDGKDPKDFDKMPAGKYVLPLVKDKKRSPAVRAQALRLVDENDPALDAALMRSFLDNENCTLQLEAVRTLQRSTAPFVGELLAAIAVDEQRPLGMRAEAIAGLAGRSNFPQKNVAVIDALDKLRTAKEPLRRLETIRALRGSVATTDRQRKVAVKHVIQALNGQTASDDLIEQMLFTLKSRKVEIPDELAAKAPKRPDSITQWYQSSAIAKGDPAAGRRTFFHIHSAGCSKCHTVNGRGGNIGPDLSRVGGALNRKRLAESILEPSKEIAPQFTNWTFVMTSGKVHSGIILGDTRDKQQTIGTTEGVTLDLPTAEIEIRQPKKNDHAGQSHRPPDHRRIPRPAGVSRIAEVN